MKKIVWGITGSGDLIKETYDVMLDIRNRSNVDITVLISKEGETVLKWYKMWDQIQNDFSKIKIEKGPNNPFIVGPLQVGMYDMLIVAPATANTVAKIVHGIGDTIITNSVSQTAKGSTPIYILPVDREKGTITTYSPQGKAIDLKMRDIDIENTNKLHDMENITVFDSPHKLYDILGISRD